MMFLCPFYKITTKTTKRSRHLKFVTYLTSENTAVLDIIVCISINLNVYGIICALVNTYRVVFIHA